MEHGGKLCEIRAINTGPAMRSTKTIHVVSCHAEGEVKQNCTLCHEYHNGHGFKHRMSATGKDGNTGGPMAN